MSSTHNGLYSLPTEILLDILGSLSYLDLLRLRRTCHRFDNIITNAEIGPLAQATFSEIAKNPDNTHLDINASATKYPHCHDMHPCIKLLIAQYDLNNEVGTIEDIGFLTKAKGFKPLSQFNNLCNIQALSRGVLSSEYIKSGRFHETPFCLRYSLQTDLYPPLTISGLVSYYKKQFDGVGLNSVKADAINFIGGRAYVRLLDLPIYMYQNRQNVLEDFKFYHFYPIYVQDSYIPLHIVLFAKMEMTYKDFCDWYHLGIKVEPW